MSDGGWAAAAAAAIAAVPAAFAAGDLLMKRRLLRSTSHTVPNTSTTNAQFGGQEHATQLWRRSEPPRYAAITPETLQSGDCKHRTLDSQQAALLLQPGQLQQSSSTQTNNSSHDCNSRHPSIGSTMSFEARFVQVLPALSAETGPKQAIRECGCTTHGLSTGSGILAPVRFAFAIGQALIASATEISLQALAFWRARAPVPGMEAHVCAVTCADTLQLTTGHYLGGSGEI